MNKKIKLDAFEKEIENGATYKPVSAQAKARIDKIIDSARKTKNISIRINEQDLQKIKDRSAKEGLPYQTLISSVLHKYITDQLLDENLMQKAIEAFKKAA